jgi:hypothetical protein
LWNDYAADHPAEPEIEPRKLTVTRTTQTLPAEMEALFDQSVLAG